MEREVTTMHKNGKEITKTIFYRLKFIESGRFIVSSLLNLDDNLAEGIHKIKCTNCKTCCIEYTNFKDGLIKIKYLCCNKITIKNLMKTCLKKKFANIYKFPNQGICKQKRLLLRKSVYHINT